MTQHKFLTALSLLALTPLTFSQPIAKTDTIQTYRNGIAIKPLITASKKTPVKKKKLLSLQLKTNSLYNNVNSFSQKHHYRLIWNVVNPTTNDTTDFKVLSGDTIKASTNLGLLKKMTAAYPVNVEVWQTNHVIRVTTSQA